TSRVTDRSYTNWIDRTAAPPFTRDGMKRSAPRCMRNATTTSSGTAPQALRDPSDELELAPLHVLGVVVPVPCRREAALGRDGELGEVEERRGAVHPAEQLLLVLDLRALGADQPHRDDLRRGEEANRVVA